MNNFKIGDIVVLVDCKGTKNWFFSVQHPYLKTKGLLFRVVDKVGCINII